MPLKNIEFGSGTLYFNNEPVVKIDECELVEESYVADKMPQSVDIKFLEPHEGIIEIKNVKINRNALLSLIHGRKVTNNWLKMHGGVMTKRKRIVRKDDYNG